MSYQYQSYILKNKAVLVTGASVIVTDLLVEDENNDTERLSEYSPLTGHFAGINAIKTEQNAREICEMNGSTMTLNLM